jgi:methanogenic corrinoid protein MtbC1
MFDGVLTDDAIRSETGRKRAASALAERALGRSGRTERSVKETGVLAERLLDACVRGDRGSARGVIDCCWEEGFDAAGVTREVLWPAYERLDGRFRADEVGALGYRLATRLLRVFVHRVASSYERIEARGRCVFVLSGPSESDELAGQITSDLLECSGFDVVFGGGGVPNDEILEFVQGASPDALVMFASGASDLPRIRSLVDTINEIGALSSTQIVLGGGVFNRASGLAEEIGADLWAEDPFEVVEAMLDEPERKMDPSQRTVGAVARPARARSSEKKAA